MIVYAIYNKFWSFFVAINNNKIANELDLEHDNVNEKDS